MKIVVMLKKIKWNLMNTEYIDLMYFLACSMFITNISYNLFKVFMENVYCDKKIEFNVCPLK